MHRRLIREFLPALVGFGDDFAINDGLAGDVAAERVVAAVDVDTVVVISDGVVWGRRLSSSLSLSEMTEEEEDELLAWWGLDLANSGVMLLLEWKTGWQNEICGLYYKNFMIINYDRKVCSKLWRKLWL